MRSAALLTKSSISFGRWSDPRVRHPSSRFYSDPISATRSPGGQEEEHAGPRPSQSRQKDATTSRVGIERLHPLVQGREELVVAGVVRGPPGSAIGVGLSLTLLPLPGPEPSLLGVAPPVRDLLQEDPGAVHCCIWKSVHELMKFGLGHEVDLACAQGHAPALT